MTMPRSARCAGTAGSRRSVGRNGRIPWMTLALGALPGCEDELLDAGLDVVQGRVQIAAPPSSSAAASAFVPFTPPAAGEVGVSVDWEPRANRVSFAVSVGVCSTSPCPSEVDMGPYTDGAQNKPISGASVLAARLHTLRIDNWGPAPASITYRVRLVP